VNAFSVVEIKSDVEKLVWSAYYWWVVHVFLAYVSLRLKPTSPCVYLLAMDPTMVVRTGNSWSI